MTHDQLAECVEAGLGHRPTSDELAEWLNGPGRTKLSQEDQLALIEHTLRGSPNEYRIRVLEIIRQIPPSHLISYGDLAKWANHEFGLNVTPRNTAWLRKQTYWTIGHDTEIPIHGIANAGDATSWRDHTVKQHINRHNRREEGFFAHPQWLIKSAPSEQIRWRPATRC